MAVEEKGMVAMLRRIRRGASLFKTSLPAQLYGLVGSLTLASWATFYWGHLHSEASGMEQVRLRASTLSLAYLENLETLLERTDAALKWQFDHWPAAGDRQPSAANPLQTLLAGYRYQLHMCDEHGNARLHAGGMFEGGTKSAPQAKKCSPKSATDRISMHATVVSTTAVNANGVPTEKLMQIRRPVFKNGKWAAEMLLTVEPGFVTQFAHKLSPNDGTVIGVMDHDGAIVAHSPGAVEQLLVPEVVLEQSAPQGKESTPMFSPMPPTEGALVAWSATLDRAVGVHPNSKRDYAALVSIDAARQMAPDRTRKHIVFVFALIFPLVLLGATRVILWGVKRREWMESAMRESERLAASVFTHAREGIVITDTEGRILDVNGTFTHITGFSRDEVLGLPPAMLKTDRHSLEFYADLRNALALKGHWSGDIWCQRKGDAPFAALLTISAVRDSAQQVQHFVVLFTDVTEAKDHERQLAHMAHYDALSNLPNRVLLADRLRQAMLQCQRRSKWLAVAYLDLDGFKEVNDLYGHDVGDAMLIAVAHQMKAALRDGDTLARVGGDEFVAVLVDLDHKEECLPVLDRLLAAAHQNNPMHLSQVHANLPVSVKVSTSIGYTYYPQDNVDADQLLRQADQAMYQAKQGGKNRYHLFDVAMDVAIKSRSENIERLRMALVREEFVLYYQPQVNLQTGQVVGAEALIRWMHPERGLLGPQHFLPLIENHSLSVELGDWVISTALNQMHHWMAQGLDFGVSVNVSARQLQYEGFSQRLAELLTLHPTVLPDSFELEILETSALEDMAKVSENIHRCHAMGVRFALDDFGTGYSSLTYLKRIPAQTLKIDQSFVRDMLDDADDLAIVQSIIGLAHSFDRSVVAEGVETAAHGKRLIQLGCTLAQGFGIARPMPASELLDWTQVWLREFVPDKGHKESMVAQPQ